MTTRMTETNQQPADYSAGLQEWTEPQLVRDTVAHVTQNSSGGVSDGGGGSTTGIPG